MRDLVLARRRLVPRAAVFARLVAAIFTSFLVLFAALPTAAQAACPNSRILNFGSNANAVGWTLVFDSSPSCALQSLVVVMKFTESNQTTHDLDFTLQFDAKTGQVKKSLGLDSSIVYVSGLDDQNSRWIAFDYYQAFNAAPAVMQLDMFASFAGHACKYAGPAYKGTITGPMATGPIPVGTNCRKKWPQAPKGPHKH
ncbi:MAG: hypothetical protein WDO17_09565 [Alphaproteobacteria bacterium]